MELPNSSQVAAFGRHVATYAAGAITAVSVLHIVSAGDAATLSDSLNKISSGFASIAAGLGPIIALVSGWYAAWSASRKSQIAAVNATPGVKVVSETAIAKVVTEPPKAGPA